MGDKDSVDDVLGLDHEVLGGLLERLKGAVAARSAEAPGALEAFSRPLAVHMDWEEQALFPAVAERATAAQRKSIESLGIDHERIRETLAALHSALSIGDFAAAGTQTAWLETLLQGHNYDEEHGVYVEADRYLSPAERRALLERFRGTRR